MRSRRHAFVQHVAAVEDLRLAGLGEDVRVLDGDVLGFGTAVGRRGDIGVEDAFAGVGNAVRRGLDDRAVGVVFDVYWAVVV